MRVACFAEEGRVNCYMKSVSISRMADSLARTTCGMMSIRPHHISIEIWDSIARQRRGNGSHLICTHELYSPGR
jgi:hypothetical protein